VQRRTRWTIGLCILIVVGLVVDLTLWWPFGNDNHRSIGSGVTATGSNLPKKLHAQLADPSVSLPYTPNVITPLSKIYQIGPSGALPGMTSFTLPLNDKFVPSDEALLLAMTAESPKGPWTPLLKQDAAGKQTAQPDVELSADGFSATVQTPHLSLFTIVKVQIGSLAEIVKDAAGVSIGGLGDVLNMAAKSFHSLTANLFAHASAPKCADTDKAKAESYTFTTDKKDTVLSCFGMQAGKRVVKMVDNRTYPLLVHHTGATVVDNGPSFKMRLAQLSKLVSGQDTVLFPMEDATFGVDLPDEGGSAVLSTEFNATAQNLYSLEVALRVAIMLFTNFGSGSGVAVNGAIKAEMPSADLLDKALGVSDCSSLVWDNDDLDFGEILNRCASPEAIMTLFGVTGLILAPIMVVAPVIAFFKSQLNALGDQFNKRDRSKLTVTRADTADLCPNGPAACGGISQADVDGDGKLDELALSTGPEHHYTVTAKLATGDIITGDAGFQERGPLQSIDDWTASDLSFVGFSDINTQPGKEIVVKIKYSTHDDFYDQGSYSTWAVSMLTFMGNRLDVVQQVDGAGFPYYTYDTGVNDWRANGFQCSKAANGQTQLVMWDIYTIDYKGQSGNSYQVSTDTYVTDPYNTYEFQVVDDGSTHTEHPLGDSSGVHKLIKQLSDTGCPGLSQLPLPRYYAGD